VISDGAGPFEPASGVLVIELALAKAKSQFQDPPAEQAENGRQERDCGENRRGDDHRRRVTERADQGDAAEVQAE
jgi:hypothetical protein